ncbi:hypothetical protein BDW42DRAFT_169900 [Aspergillus taichungensis]|uniref:Uncharacterized protein n=1 Tax=Aspergillus taichungensis TaxID=482145 RepID=A0A2J5HU68_9EURO|nr:hypothetical protein BDW42DRAFT_169900 [Aspergillus taichungensis]
MPTNRLRMRNINFYVASTGQHLGGLWQEGHITDANIHWMLGNVLLIVDEAWSLKHRASNRTVMPSDDIAAEGDYDIHSNGSIRMTDEPWAPRSLSYSISSRENLFCQGVRARDGKCVITGKINRLAPLDQWFGFQAAHVFPLRHGSLWNQDNYSRWIREIRHDSGISGINSVQNGLLMHASVHLAFDQYAFSINPDDNYKITSFHPDNWDVDGRILDFVCRDPDDPNHVSDEVLRWHFRQAVLGNVRGQGEPIFETDFPPGSDIMGTLRQEPYGKERLEMELFRRLGELEE